MREIISEYGSAVVGVVAAVFVIAAIVALFMNGGAVADVLLDHLNQAF